MMSFITRTSNGGIFLTFLGFTLCWRKGRKINHPCCQLAYQMRTGEIPATDFDITTPANPATANHPALERIEMLRESVKERRPALIHPLTFSIPAPDTSIPAPSMPIVRIVADGFVDESPSKMPPIVNEPIPKGMPVCYMSAGERATVSEPITTTGTSASTGTVSCTVHNCIICADSDLKPVARKPKRRKSVKRVAKQTRKTTKKTKPKRKK